MSIKSSPQNVGRALVRIRTAVGLYKIIRKEKSKTYCNLPVPRSVRAGEPNLTARFHWESGFFVSARLGLNLVRLFLELLKHALADHVKKSDSCQNIFCALLSPHDFALNGNMQHCARYENFELNNCAVNNHGPFNAGKSNTRTAHADIGDHAILLLRPLVFELKSSHQQNMDARISPFFYIKR